MKIRKKSDKQVIEEVMEDFDFLKCCIITEKLSENQFELGLPKKTLRSILESIADNFYEYPQTTKITSKMWYFEVDAWRDDNRELQITVKINAMEYKNY